ncbi:hypothetical protein F5B20DRAFT_584900 [Whalleya microplaca]|nr:hypothetical protein F5B20DRAFT_584900 [Whalleya microplaca]
MADPSRRGRNRLDSRTMWDESDRRNRQAAPGPGRDRRGEERDRQPRDEANPVPNRDRNRRYRSRSRSPRRERRDRNRSRSRERRDRDRELDRGRPRDFDRARPRGDDRHAVRGRERRRDVDREPRQVDDAAPRGPERERESRRSASPAPSTAGKFDRSEHNSPLPTRPRHAASTSLSFKVGKHEDDPDHRGPQHKGKGRQEMSMSPARRATSERTDTPHSEGEAMDQDNEDDDVVVEEDDGLSAMQAMMGFGGFGTTKGNHVVGNHAGAVRKVKKTEYRQYMNRVGGFNRPLSPTR